MAEVIYLADRVPKDLYPNRLAEFREAVAVPGDLLIFPFGAITRSERMRERRAGWSSKAIAAVRISEERRGNRK